MSLSNHPQILIIFIFVMLAMQITWAITFSVAGFHLVQSRFLQIELNRDF